ncbi:MAG: insulinase family protein [Actinomycetota bacterium]|nr:insulinase family protein [Actinomycetota bacterium]
MTVRTARLPGGLRVVTESMADARSVTAGFWVGIGSRDESTDEAGTSHFLEHLLFKGTDSRSATTIAEAVEAVGGEMNAFTTAEHTAYFVRLPASELALALDILSEVVWAPALRGTDVDAERRVILEELAMEEDSPEDRVLTLLTEALFPGHPLGREVLGSRRSIEAMAPEAIGAFHHHWYRPANTVVAVAGDLDHDRVVDLVQAAQRREGGDAPVRPPPAEPPTPLSVLRRRTEQVHVALGVRALATNDDDRFALAVANQILGGGTASRLFQSVREERGLAYSVYSYVDAHLDTGALVVYAGTAPERLAEVLGLLRAGLERLAVDGPDQRELAVATGYLAGSTLLGLEDSAGRMHRIAGSLLLHDEVTPVQDVVERFRQVTAADVARVLTRVLAPTAPSVAVVGPVTRRTVASALV